jgi:hypothetical protein
LIVVDLEGTCLCIRLVQHSSDIIIFTNNDILQI